MTEPASVCELAGNATTTTVPVCAKRNVCYEFDTSATEARLAIPYLVVLDGEIQASGRPGKLSAANRTIRVKADTGSKVALYLNSDVHPNHRRHPVYEVVVNNHDVFVKITECLGNRDPARPVIERGALLPPLRPGAASVEHYTAKLTGDIWMVISHRYSEAEAGALLPADTDPVIRRSVCSIYRGLGTPRLDIPLLTAGETLGVSFLRQSNPEENISRCSLLADVLPRTHPQSFAAIFTAARKVGLSQLHITSCWRPSFGSIVHRAGLGLDANAIASASRRVPINRIGLRDVGRSRNPNITDQEKELRRTADEKAEIAQRPNAGQQERDDASASLRDWTTEMSRSEPALMRQLRAELKAQNAVQEIMDPWYVVAATSSRDLPRANEQKTRTEKVHNNHLHITIKEPRIL